LQTEKQKAPPDASDLKDGQQGAKHVHAVGRRPGSPPEETSWEKPPLGAKGTSPRSPSTKE
jgi:hypothetical protein